MRFAHAWVLSALLAAAPPLTAQEEPDGCVACHDSWADDDDATAAVLTTQTTFKTELDLVQTELFNRGWVDSADPTEIPHIVTGTYANADDLGAIWNFLFLAEDKSLSVHNPVYANDVLNATKAYLGLP